MRIDPRALVDPGATLADDVEVGPFCVVGPNVEIGTGCRLIGRVTLAGAVRLGARNTLYSTVCIGGPPQDHEPPASDGRIEIGMENVFREAVTVHLPKTPGRVTRIGSRCRFGFGSHVAHDVTLGDEVTLGRLVLLSGHVTVEDHATFGDQIPVHQFVTVGRHARIRSHSVLPQDIPPYMDAEGNHCTVVDLNRDSGLPPPVLAALELAYLTVWREQRPRREALALLDESPVPEVRELSIFLRRSTQGRLGRAQEVARRA